MYQFFHGTVHVTCSESFYRVLHQMIYFLSMILFKLLRLLVPYLTVLLLLKISTQYFEEVSVVEIPSNDDTCAETMWRNILFIDIFFPMDQRVSSFDPSFNVKCLIYIALVHDLVVVSVSRSLFLCYCNSITAALSNPSSFCNHTLHIFLH